MSSYRTPIALLVGAVLFSVGCDNYDGLELQILTDPPGDVSVNATSVTLPQGVMVGVKLRAPGAEDTESGEVDAIMRSNDPSIATTWSTADENTFVIAGVKEGVTTITVTIAGQGNEQVAVTVGEPADP